MYGRQYSDKFLGHRILEMPVAHRIINHWVRQSEEEEIIYRYDTPQSTLVLQLIRSHRYQEKIFRSLINEYLKMLKETNGETKRMAFFLILIGSLRQLTAHPFLGDGSFRRYWRAVDFQYIIGTLTTSGVPTNRVFLEQMEAYAKYRRQCDDRLSKNQRHQDQPDQFFARLRGLEEHENSRGLEGVTCRICSELPGNPQISKVCLSPSAGV